MNIETKKAWRGILKGVIAWTLCLVWMGVIFGMSSMTGDESGAQSGWVVQKILMLLQVLSGGTIQLEEELLHVLIRKGGHMTEYAILCVLYTQAMKVSGMRHPWLKALIGSALMGASDEWHQSFVDGRGPSVIDVGIDTTGAVLGGGIAHGFHLWKMRKMQK